MLNLKARSDLEGIQKIVSIKASMNWGLSDTLITQFPTVQPVPRPIVNFVRVASLEEKRLYSTNVVSESNLCPYWVSGFADAESSFSLSMFKSSKSKAGWAVRPDFIINLHSKDTALLRMIHSFFGVGTIREREDRNVITYTVSSVRDITNVIIPHFDKYPLVTHKLADYLLFKKGVDLLNRKAHHELEGIMQILSAKASMNKGLSLAILSEFPTVIPDPRPRVNSDVVIPHPNWLTGFVDGEGCFYVLVSADKNYSTGVRVKLTFYITQHRRDELLMAKLIEYLGCGRVNKPSTRSNEMDFVVTKIGDILGKIIPFFFQKYPLQGVKSLDLRDFCAVAKIMEDKSHLTLEGMRKIKSLKSGMITGRINS